jgi:diadenosine tetraphosphate (Ap4A) HIT family hydrolase
MNDHSTTCAFCTLDDPAVTVYSDALVQALVSRAPINRYHVIVVPRVHCERLVDLPGDVLTAAVRAAQLVGRAIIDTAQPDGITYITEDDLTGQGYNLVAHWKLHVIARFRTDGIHFEWHRSADPGEAARAEIAGAILRSLDRAI